MNTENTENTEQTKEIVREVYQALEDKKAEDIQIIDILGISVVADYFVVASVNNPNQLAACQEAVEEVMEKDHGIFSRQVEGNKNSTWMLMDYGDIIVHLFTKEDRLFYNLERIWKDGRFVTPAEL